jgi:hypothetical protein
MKRPFLLVVLVVTWYVVGIALILAGANSVTVAIKDSFNLLGTVHDASFGFALVFAGAAAFIIGQGLWRREYWARRLALIAQYACAFLALPAAITDGNPQKIICISVCAVSTLIIYWLSRTSTKLLFLNDGHAKQVAP